MRLFDVVLPNASDDIVFYVGTDANAPMLRAGVHNGNTFVFTINLGVGHGDQNTWAPIDSFVPGDDIELNLSRVAGDWTFSWVNLSDSARNGSLPGQELPWLNSESDLYAGVIVMNGGTPNVFTAIIDNFTIDIRRPVLGDTNGDFVVDLSDLNAVRNNFGASLGASAASSYRQAADAVFAQWTAARSVHFTMEPEASAPGGIRAYKVRASRRR